ncbi:MAG: T9SS type A sorting domain-containing protein [Flavobacterium sp.]|nr:T9SS type A sorting domain-containing protein [Flavobacterium sp.]
MKKISLFALFLLTTLSYSQYNAKAPWMNDNEVAKKSETTIDDLVTLFNAYWETHDKSKKGSGYKPFMRWENHWRNKTNSQGYLITPQQMWDAFNAKKRQSLQRNSNATLSAVSNWESVGPFTHTNTGSWSSGQGRVNTILVDPNNAATVYMGTPAGGIWKSTNNGDAWTPLGDNLPQIGVSGIAVDYANSNTIYIATGDCDAADTYSVGVLKSTNGGLTWNTTGLSFSNTDTFAGDILIHPTDSNMLWVATSDGIYRTTNAGATWTQVQTGDFSQGRIRLKPGTPSTVYAVSNNRFYRSINSGATFSMITTGLPSSSGRLLLDVTPANSEYIYILSATSGYGFQGIYRSTNGGSNWTKTSDNTNIFESSQAWYDLALAVSTTNANEVYTGCLNVWKSTNGGATSTKINNWNDPNAAAYTHADIHYLRCFANKLYCGSDGGIYVSEDNANSFADKTATAQIGQFYRISVSKQTASKMVGGLQDNGGYAYSNGQWKNYYGADGMDTAVHPTNSNLFYGFIQSGGNMYISNDGGNTLSSSVGAPGGENGNWITPLAMNSAGELFSGYTNLYKLNGSNWQQQNNTAFNGNTLEVIAIDPNNDNNMYVADGNNFFKSTDKGLTFSSVYFAPADITSIDVHSSNSNIIYITTSGIDGEALMSTDGGNSFNSISEGLPSIGKNVIVHQGRNSDNPLYLGTSLGVYYRDDTMTQWEPFDTNLPNVSVSDLEINLEDAKIVAATYGRGIWQSSIPVQIPANDVKLTEIVNPSSVNINCNSDVAPQVTVKNNGQNPITTINFDYAYNAVPYNYSWSGNLNPNESTLITLPTVSLAKGAYSFEITSNIPNDAYSDNNSAQGVFYINDSGTVNLTNTFENTSDDLLENDEGSATGIWTRDVKTGGLLATGSNKVYTTNTSGNYPDMIKSFLVSECYDLTQLANPQISFKLAYDLENNWDILYVQYSTNLGQTWEVLGSMGTNWYNSDRTPDTSGTDCYNCVGAQWTGTNSDLLTYNYLLSDFNSETNIIFRFVFQSDQSVVAQGVVIDDFLISGTLSNANFDINDLTIYPNPSNGIFNIAKNDIAIDSIEVFDVLGKKMGVKINNQNSNNLELDLTNVSTGIYFVKIQSNSQITTKKITKK